MSEKYNGWTNYETWCVKLWMDNDQGSCEYQSELAQECWDEADGDKDDAVRAIAERLEAMHDEGMDEMLGANRSSVYADMLGAAFREVNWHEIAEHVLEDADIEVEETAEADDE